MPGREFVTPASVTHQILFTRAPMASGRPSCDNDRLGVPPQVLAWLGKSSKAGYLRAAIAPPMARLCLSQRLH
jgi:hypothetical protein